MLKHINALCVLFVALAPAVALSAPSAVPADRAAKSGLVQVQGWWEESHHEGELRERYWHLPPGQRARYDHIEYEIRNLAQQREDAERRGDRPAAMAIASRIDHKRDEQRQILRWGGHWDRDRDHDRH